MTKEEFDKAVQDAINNFPVEEYSDMIVKNIINQMVDTRLRGKTNLLIYENQLVDFLDSSHCNRPIPSVSDKKIKERVVEKLKNLNYQIETYTTSLSSNPNISINIKLD